nr:metalloregulator ArsR/SmtB family transcription factor [Pararhizobium antarcticum]
MESLVLSERSLIISGKLLSAFANSRRLLILSVLSRGEVCVGDLANALGMSHSALSQHLSKLRAQNLVKRRRDAQTIYYSSSSEAVLKVLKALSEIYPEANFDELELDAHGKAGSECPVISD